MRLRFVAISERSICYEKEEWELMNNTLEKLNTLSNNSKYVSVCLYGFSVVRNSDLSFFILHFSFFFVSLGWKRLAFLFHVSRILDFCYKKLYAGFLSESYT